MGKVVRMNIHKYTAIGMPKGQGSMYQNSYKQRLDAEVASLA